MPKKSSYCQPLVTINGISQFPDGMPSNMLIDFLSRLQQYHGILRVFFADGYDNALSINCVNIKEDPGWDGAPKGKAIYLS